MKYLHEYKSEQILPITVEQAWDFFASPKNLAVITPPEMEFQILTKDLNDGIYEGMEIEYKIRPMLKIPVKWKSRLCRIEAGKSFTDIQLKGPYSFWEHTHSFEKNAGGTLVRDVLRYKVPLGFFGNWMNSWFVRKKIEKVFEFRRETLERMFNE